LAKRRLLLISRGPCYRLSDSEGWYWLGERELLSASNSIEGCYGHWPGENGCVLGYNLSPLSLYIYSLLAWYWYGSWDSCKLQPPGRYQAFPDPYYRDTKLLLAVFKAVIYRQKVRILDTLDTFGYSKFWILCRNLGG